ncbi:MAG: GNAT family N-acetyltransferase [Bdellovibrionales bacterium]
MTLPDTIEIRFDEGSPSPRFEKIRAALTSFNEKALGKKRKTALMTACIGDEVIGGISFKWYGESAVLDIVAIEEKWQRRGIGTRLLEAVEKELQRQGCRQICVGTDAFQAPDFYRKLGYQQAVTIPDYINGHDHLIFRKKIGKGKK